MRRFLSFCVAVFTSSLTLADGKVFSMERVPPDIPYQRALILFQDGQQTMVLQSRFAASGDADAAYGWVVPVPAVPELDSADAVVAFNVFFHLGRVSGPHVHHLGITAFLIWLGAFAVLMVLHAKRKARGTPEFATVVGLLLVVVVLVMIVLPSFQKARSSIEGVEILQSGQVGIFDTRVITSDRPSALVAWLNEHGFQYSESDEPVLQDYLDRGWCFTVAKVRAGEDPSTQQAGDGLIDPLIFRFPAEAPVYPLALTATIGSKTEVLLYLFSDRKFVADKRIPLHFAGTIRHRESLLSETFGFRPEERELDYLCKFKATLTPRQMETDLVFQPASNNEPYRKTVIKW